MGVFAGTPRRGNPDPTAGVSLIRLELCPRCGISKGKKGNARRGLCHDCATTIEPRERRTWAA